MNENPLVSVLINNYNYGHFIAEAIQSALDQSYTNTEIIVVDDGSTDHSCEVIRSFQKRYPGRIQGILKENGGQASALNAGFAAANGEIICFLDSDDYWFGRKVASVVGRHGEFSVVQHNLLQNGSRFRLLVNTGDLQRFLKEFGLIRSCVPTSALSFRRELLEKIFPLPEEPLRLCADVYLRCAAVYYSKTFSIDECLGTYRLHGNNGWHDNMRFSHPNIVNEILDILNCDLAARGLPPIPKRTDSREQSFLHSIDVEHGKKYLLYGAGGHGVKLGRKIKSLGGEVSGFFDDEPSKWGCSVMGCPIHSPDHVLKLRRAVHKVVISCVQVERVYEKLTDIGLKFPDDFLVPIDLEGHVTVSRSHPSTTGHCPVCGNDVGAWKPFTRKVGEGHYCQEPGGRLCPFCSSFERTRHFWIYMGQSETLKSKPRMLHVAPEKGLQSRLKDVLADNYVSIDMSMANADIKADLIKLPFPDAFFDLIYCSNVLEHIEEDMKAMDELFRVLAPGGTAYIQVPIIGDRTQEDPAVTDAAERARLFGQADHVRQYGRDIAFRLSEVGFRVREMAMPEALKLDQKSLDRFNCTKRELVHICSKERCQ